MQALRGLGEKVEGLARRTAAIAVTAQGDGTWLVGAGERAGRRRLALARRARRADGRAAEPPGALERARFEATGTGLNTCQQGAQMAEMERTAPGLLDRAEVALHCKDWLYLNLTGVRATDPSEASWTFGNFRTRRYDDTVIEALGLTRRRGLLPEIVEGTEVTHPLTAAAARGDRAAGRDAGQPRLRRHGDDRARGRACTPATRDAACTVIGSTGVHLLSKRVEEVTLNAEGTGYVMALPVPGYVTQMQTNMAAALNIDWALRLAADLMAGTGHEIAFSDLVAPHRAAGWRRRGRGRCSITPISPRPASAGRSSNANARAGFIGLSSGHRFPDLLRAVVEGLGLAARDCYAAMGELPSELRLTGGAARSRALRGGAGGRGAGAGARVGPRGGRRGRRGDDGRGGDRRLSVDGRLHRAAG